MDGVCGAWKWVGQWCIENERDVMGANDEKEGGYEPSRSVALGKSKRMRKSASPLCFGIASIIAKP